MSSDSTTTIPWLLDSSTFIHANMIERFALVVSLRKPLSFPEYVFLYELGANAHDETRVAASACVKRNQVRIENLLVSDLERIAALGAPRRIGLGEIACVVIAERLTGGVLCDDREAKKWLVPRTGSIRWQCLEEVLLDAAISGHIGELDLVDFQNLLRRERYDCYCDLRLEFLSRRMKPHATSLGA